MDAVLFDQWFASHFLVYASSIQPLLLLHDGHVSHRGGHYCILSAAAYYTPSTAAGQWYVCILKGSEEV